MALFSVLCIFWMQKVEINEDMTKYLPDDSAMKAGMDIMTDADKETVIEKLEAIEYVDSVSYEADSKDYNVDNHTLFVINTSYAYGSSEELSIEEALDTQFSEYTRV